MTDTKPRKGMPDPKLGHDEFTGRFLTQFRDPAFRAALGYAIYQRGFQNFQMGYASAIAWVMFALIMALTALQFWFQRKWVHYDA